MRCNTLKQQVQGSQAEEPALAGAVHEEGPAAMPLAARSAPSAASRSERVVVGWAACICGSRTVPVHVHGSTAQSSSH